MKITKKLMMGMLALAISGCTEKTIFIEDDEVPAPPTGLTSITGDEVVYLSWYAVSEPDIHSYVIYRNTTGPNEVFRELARVTASHTSYNDHDVVNGVTYYYALTTIDENGQESDLSDYTFDTPRPEGFNEVIYDFHNSLYYSLTGFDLYAGERIPYDDVNCDIFLEYDSVSGAFFIHVRHTDYFIQDFGYAEDFDEVTFAPEFGWSEFGNVEAIEGHMYILKLWHFEQWHYARVWVTDLRTNPPSMEFSWAYQVDPDNRELKVRPDVLKHAAAEVVAW